MVLAANPLSPSTIALLLGLDTEDVFPEGRPSVGEACKEVRVIQAHGYVQVEQRRVLALLWRYVVGREGPEIETF